MLPMTISWSDLERAMAARNTVAVNLHRHADGYRVHSRHQDSDGFSCAQQAHSTIESALCEHFPELRKPQSKYDLSDLLV
jgi:hypothetical protein